MNQSDDLIPTRDTLLSRLRNWDDTESWQEFFDVYWKLLYRVARQSGLGDLESQEVVQTTLISVCTALRNFKYNRSQGSFKGWLLNNLRWRINEHHRRRTAEMNRFAEIGQISELSYDAFERLWDLEFEQTLAEAALARVKHLVATQHFQMFELATVQGWPVKRVAAAFRVRSGYVYLVVYRVKRRLAAELRRLQDHPERCFK